MEKNMPKEKYIEKEQEMEYVKSIDYDPHNPLPRLNNGDQEGEESNSLFDAQSSYMAAEDYDQLHNSNKLRKWASLVFYKYSKCENFDVIIPYIAMTYFDLYISRGNPILRVMNDIVQDIEFLALCCLTLAWKMRDVDFTVENLQQMQPDLVDIEILEIQTVELQILKGIKWNLRVVTAFCFVPYFVPKCITPHGFNLRTINEIIVGIQCHEVIGIRIAEKKPSVIAASALVAATKFMYPQQYRGVVKEILEEDHERLFANDVISACNAMNLVIESGDVEGESAPPRRIRVRARRWLRHKVVGPGEPLSDTMDFPLRWSPAMRLTKLFVAFGSQTRMEWPPCGSDTEQNTRHLVRIALMSAVRDLYMERLCILCNGIAECLSHGFEFLVEILNESS